MLGRIVHFLSYRQVRDPVSGYTHLAAAILAVIGTVYLIAAGHDTLLKVVSLAVYGASLVLLYTASAVYHLANVSPPVLLRLRKFDHSAIYLLIAGSYTPICLFYFHGFYRWGLPAIVWALAVIGIAIKLFVINAPRWITAGAYLVMGWLCVLAVPQMITDMPAPALAWLAAGGLIYTLGALVYVIKKPDPFPGVFGFHEIWHIFVILGSLCQYIAVASYVVR